MYGLIHECTKQLCLSALGEEMYKQILQTANFENGKENNMHHYYNDNDTYAIIDAICLHAKMNREEVWELFGVYFVEWVMNQGWEEMLRCLSPDLRGFVNNLDSLHYFVDHVVYKANLKGPSFRCEASDDETITLHYFSERSGLWPIVKGIVKEVGKKIYNLDVNMNVLGRTQRSVQMGNSERIEEHVIFLIKPANPGQPLQKRSLGSTPSIDDKDKDNIASWTLRVNQADFHAILPYHFIMDRDCRLVQIGSSLAKFVPYELLQNDIPVMKLFEIQRPQIPFDFDNVLNFINAVFVLQVRSVIKPQVQTGNIHGRSSNSSAPSRMSAGDGDSIHTQKLKLKGQMMLLSSGTQLIYLCSPYVTNVSEVLMYNLRLNSFPMHDATRDLILLNQQRLNDVDDNIQLEANNEQLEQMAREVEGEKARNDALLREVLPAGVAEQLMSGATVDAREFQIATVMFADCPAFQKIVPLCKPSELVTILNSLFTKFDNLITVHGAYKVETVGDSYMTCGGIPNQDTGHCEKICHIALGFLWEARSTFDPINNQPLQVRCGIHSGPIVAGVVGSKMPRYCLFGDTVNTASRMESHSPIGRIHCSEAAKKCAEETGRFEFSTRGIIPIKGKGLMETHFLRKSLKKSVWEIIGRERDINIHSIDGYQELLHGISEDLQEKVDVNKNSKSCSLM